MSQTVRDMWLSKETPRLRTREAKLGKNQEYCIGDSDTVLTPQVVEKGKSKQKSLDKDMSSVLLEGSFSETASTPVKKN